MGQSVSQQQWHKIHVLYQEELRHFFKGIANEVWHSRQWYVFRMHMFVSAMTNGNERCMRLV